MKKRTMFADHLFRCVFAGLTDGKLFGIDDLLLSVILVPSV